jgi:ribose-phosphate pyrophosphokinase
MDGRLQIFTGNANRALAEAICHELQLPLGRALVSTFSDGETRVRLDENVRGSDVFVIQPGAAPVDHHIMELLLMLEALKRSSAQRVTAVIPYYPYARQEKKTAGREPISARLLADLLVTAGADRILTLDLHAPAIEGFFSVPVDHLRAAPILANYIRRQRMERLVVVSPDSGGVARASDFRSRVGGALAVFAKNRPEPEVAEMLEMVGDVEGRTAIIVDDIISTGGTLLDAAAELKRRGAARIVACAVHAILSGDAAARLIASDLEQLIITDTLPVPPEKLNHKVQVLTVAPLLAEAIMRIHKDLSISAMFV